MFYFLYIFVYFDLLIAAIACALHGLAWLSNESCVACVQVIPRYLWAWVMGEQAPLWAPEPGLPQSRSNPTARAHHSSSNSSSSSSSRAAMGNRLWRPSCQ